MHIPVLLQEVVTILDPQPGKKVIDATLGLGGHTRQLLELGSTVLGIDRDPHVIASVSEAILMSNKKIASSPDFRRGPRNDRLKIVQGDFSDLKEIAEANGFTNVDGILFDLGLGSHQLDDPERGFAFQKEGPLDMRYNRLSKIQIPKSPPSSARGGLRRAGKFQTASDIVNYYSEKDLISVFQNYGEEYRFAKRVARAISETRKTERILTTTKLFDIIKKSLPSEFRFKAGDVARKIFQALRIEVNQELANLEKALPQAFDLLKRHGKLVVISFHSLEDRIVKNFFAAKAKGCICPVDFPVCRCSHRPEVKILTKKPIRPSQEEIKLNPRSRSAKLRAAVKI